MSASSPTLARLTWDRALEDCGLDADPALRTTLHDYFANGIRRMAEHPETPDTVPDGLRLEQWTLE
ncbi:hypothetical protein N802_18810 [Knoellia sinensis KCTC 19936]|uniref:Uncharacterized protein n=2 Tax=Knoellia TaxID=136099 RepID=A0A0A0J5C5_9MICO|nr:hypothetical protein N802_18810 [Knoellia sinensis KCTC 19936]